MRETQPRADDTAALITKLKRSLFYFELSIWFAFAGVIAAILAKGG